MEHEFERCYFCNDVLETKEGIVRGHLDIDGLKVCSDCLVQMLLNQQFSFKDVVLYNKAKKEKPKLHLV